MKEKIFKFDRCDDRCSAFMCKDCAIKHIESLENPLTYICPNCRHHI